MSPESSESRPVLHSGDQEATHVEVKSLQEMLLVFMVNYKFTTLHETAHQTHCIKKTELVNYIILNRQLVFHIYR